MLELSMRDLGGSGPILLLLHCNGFPSQMLTPMASALKEYFHVLTLDMPGHGESGRMTEGWRPLDMALRIFRHIQESGLMGCYCFGHSLGAAMALLIEAEVHPGTFSALFVFEPPLMTPRDQADIIAAYSNGAVGPELDEMARRRRRTFDSRESARERLEPKMLLDPRVFALYLLHGLKPIEAGGEAVELACDPAVEEEIYLKMDPPPTSSNLRSIEIPVTIAVGDTKDGPHARLVNSSLSLHKCMHAIRSRLLQFEGMSHFGPFEKPEVVAASIIDSFLKPITGIRSRI
jgi:pimeloyl-ACP methyl ester carboxylesterase